MGNNKFFYKFPIVNLAIEQYLNGRNPPDFVFYRQTIQEFRDEPKALLNFDF